MDWNKVIDMLIEISKMGNENHDSIIKQRAPTKEELCKKMEKHTKEMREDRLKREELRNETVSYTHLKGFVTI